MPKHEHWQGLSIRSAAFQQTANNNKLTESTVSSICISLIRPSHTTNLSHMIAALDQSERPWEQRNDFVSGDHVDFPEQFYERVQ